MTSYLPLLSEDKALSESRKLVLPDRAKLDLQIRATIEFNFGSICDIVSNMTELGYLTEKDGETLKRHVRRYGNDAIRVIGNHLEFYIVSRNHRKDSINSERVVQSATEGQKS